MSNRSTSARGATDGSMPVGSAEIIYVIFQNKWNIRSTTSTPSTQRMLLIDARLIRPQFPCPASLGYLSLVAYAQLMGQPEYFGSPQKRVNLMRLYAGFANGKSCETYVIKSM